jgi:hypothetical protein
MNLELLIAVLFGGLLVHRGLFSTRRTSIRIIAMSFGTLIIVAAVSQSISRHSADEHEILIAVELYQNQITPEIKICAAQARPFHNKSPEDFLVLASQEYEQNNIDQPLDFAYAGLHLNPKNK